ncbi:hypothetical protein [Rhodococcus daqingensis]|uniref:AB hydrolase-1 domain-containing protein n=1 Tax=Rhodococcus daqingensis TaxID=2479363 RepID=A0ABW2S3X5_9NOCA
MITVLACRGIGESLEANTLNDVTRHLDPEHFRVVEVPWPASYGPAPLLVGPAFDESLRTGHTMLLNRVLATKGPIVLLGYSGGAALVGNVAAALTPLQANIIGVGLIADPFMPEWASPGAGEFGIAGSRSIIAGFPVWWLCDPNDVIGRCPRNSPLRTVTDQTRAFSLANLLGWGADLARRLTLQEWQQVAINWRDPSEVRAIYARARRGLAGYLVRGDHQSYHLRTMPGQGVTYTRWLANRINELERSHR